MIKRIELTEFMVHESLELDLDLFTLIVGANASGKSAIRDAIEFCLTGTARGLKFKNEATSLTRDGERKGEVLLRFGDADGKEITTTRATSRPSGPCYAGRDPELLRVLCDPFRVVRMDTKERQRFLSSLCKEQGFGDWLAKEGARFLEDERFRERVEEILVLTTDDIDTGLKEAVEARKEGKRAAKNGPALPEAPNGSLTIADKKYDLGVISPAEVDRQVKALEDEELPPLKKQREAALRASGGGVLTSEKDLRKQLAALEKTEKAIAKDGGGLEDAKDKLAKAESARLAAQSEFDEAARLHTQLVEQETAAKKQHDAAEAAFTGADKPTCPLSGQACAMTPAAAKKVLAKMKTAVDDATKAANAEDKNKIRCAEALSKAIQAVEDANAAVAGAQQTEADAADVSEKKKSIEADLKRLSGAQEAEAEVEKLNEEITALTTRIENGKELQRAIKKFHADLSAYQDAQERRKAEAEKAGAAVKLFDELAQWLDDDVREHFVETSIAEVEFDADLMKRWGLKVAFDPDGTLTVQNLRKEKKPVRPVELCSRSEQFRAGVLVQAFAAQRTEGFFVADEADLLETASRGALLCWAAKVTANGLQAIILATSDVEEFENQPKHMTFYRLQD